MKILVFNCGSSSIKYRLFCMPGKDVLAKGIVEKIGMNDSLIIHENESENRTEIEMKIDDHQAGIDFILSLLTSHEHGCLKNIREIEAVGHRIVHGGEEFQSSILITKEVLKQIEKCVELAPLHNLPNLKGIYAMEKIIPGIKQVAVFDTSLHHTMPDYAFMYAIPYEYYEKKRIRRYGFHGMSHHYVSNRACEILNVDFKEQKIISCHLGNGSSITAIDKGKSIDTSMGYTPLEGLMMGTRSGDLDVGVVTHIMATENLSYAYVNSLLNQRSGLLGISGISSDIREIEIAVSKKKNKKAELALNMYCYRVKKYIGAYIAALNGIDLLIFTGGIGENQPFIRKTICTNLNYLGIELDDHKNQNTHAEEKIISLEKSNAEVMVIPTNEELVIAIDTLQIITS